MVLSILYVRFFRARRGKTEHQQKSSTIVTAIDLRLLLAHRRKHTCTADKADKPAGSIDYWNSFDAVHNHHTNNLNNRSINLYCHDWTSHNVRSRSVPRLNR